MKALCRIVLASAALSAALAATAGGANAGVLGTTAIFKTAPIIAVAKPSASLRSGAYKFYAIPKICLSTYDPAPGAPNHFMATKICDAPSSQPDGASCTCPVVVNGRTIQAQGTVHTDKGGSGPIVK